MDIIFMSIIIVWFSCVLVSIGFFVLSYLICLWLKCNDFKNERSIKNNV